MILNPRHLERVLPTYLEHYNHERPHRALDLTPTDASAAPGNRRDHPPRPTRAP